MSTLLKLLSTEGYRFSFFQAIKLLEQMRGDSPEIGHLGPSEQENVRIKPNSDLSFSPGDVKSIGQKDNGIDGNYWEVVENFMGLYGPNTASPIFIAEMIAQCTSDEDSLRDFLDLFNHRIMSLYYRAWKKYTLSACIEPQFTDVISGVFMSLLGKDVDIPAEQWVVPPSRLLRYSILLSSYSRSAVGLQNLLSDYFQVDNVAIIQFAKKKYKPEGQGHNQIGTGDSGGKIGQSFVVGEVITDIAGQFFVQLRDLSMEEFECFLPGKPAYEELVFLTELYTKRQLDFSLELVLKPNQSKPMEISSETPTGALGRSSWIGHVDNRETKVTLNVREY